MNKAEEGQLFQVRCANEEDIDALLIMAESFFNESGYSEFGEFDFESTKETMLNLIGNKTLLCCEVGMIGFVVFPLYMSRNTIMAQEVFWWVNDDFRGSRIGLDLLRSAEIRASEMGASIMNMICLEKLNGDKVGLIYNRLGYEKRENSYMRIL